MQNLENRKAKLLLNSGAGPPPMGSPVFDLSQLEVGVEGGQGHEGWIGGSLQILVNDTISEQRCEGTF